MPPHLQDALARFRATADGAANGDGAANAAVEQGRRVADEDRDRGAAHARSPKRRPGDPGSERERLTPADPRAVVRQYRVQVGLPVLDLPTSGGLPGIEAGDPAAVSEDEDEDFSTNRLMRRL